MRLLFDQGTPNPLRRHLPGHSITTAAEAGLDAMDDRDLLDAAEGNYDVLVTTDQNLRHQQNMAGRSIAVVVGLTTDWTVIRHQVTRVADAVRAMAAGRIVEVAFPRPAKRRRP